MLASIVRQAATEGLTVTESVDRLKRLHWSLKRLHGIFVLRLTAMPVYELKMAFSLHAHYRAEHGMHLGNRIREMRQPPYGLDVSPEPSLDIFYEWEIAVASASWFSELIQDYDWADEIVHAKAGRELVADAGGLGQVARKRAYRPPQLVAGGVHRGLQDVGYGARPRGARL